MKYQIEIFKSEIRSQDLEKLVDWLKTRKISFAKMPNKIIIEVNDYLEGLKFMKLIDALKAGFEFENAKNIVEKEWIYETIDIKKAAERKLNHKIRLLSRAIGEKGKTLGKMEELTGAKIIIDNRYIHILGDPIAVQTALEAFKKLLRGSPHNIVYDFAVRYKRHLKNKEKEAKYYLNL